MFDKITETILAAGIEVIIDKEGDLEVVDLTLIEKNPQRKVILALVKFNSGQSLPYFITATKSSNQIIVDAEKKINWN